MSPGGHKGVGLSPPLPIVLRGDIREPRWLHLWRWHILILDYSLKLKLGDTTPFFVDLWLKYCECPDYLPPAPFFFSWLEPIERLLMGWGWSIAMLTKKGEDPADGSLDELNNPEKWDWISMYIYFLFFFWEKQTFDNKCTKKFYLNQGVSVTSGKNGKTAFFYWQSPTEKGSFTIFYVLPLVVENPWLKKSRVTLPLPIFPLGYPWRKMCHSI